MSKPTMTDEEHKQRHIELHRAFDELLADWLRHDPDAYASPGTKMRRSLSFADLRSDEMVPPADPGTRRPPLAEESAAPPAPNLAP
jgi:hypothetical protein